MKKNSSSKKTPKTAGFTLAEMLVSVALFAVVVTVAMGALITVLNANRKAQALQSVMNNLNFALEQMSRDMRVATNYDCGAVLPAAPTDCSGSSAISYTSHDGNTVTYSYVPFGGSAAGGKIVRSISSVNGGTAQDITSNDITIQALNFSVTGSSGSDTEQPKIFVTLNGYAGGDPGHPETKTYFNLQTSVSSRRLDR